MADILLAAFGLFSLPLPLCSLSLCIGAPRFLISVLVDASTDTRLLTLAVKERGMAEGGERAPERRLAVVETDVGDRTRDAGVAVVPDTEDRGLMTMDEGGPMAPAIFAFVAVLEPLEPTEPTESVAI